MEKPKQPKQPRDPNAPKRTRRDGLATKMAKLDKQSDYHKAKLDQIGAQRAAIHREMVARHNALVKQADAMGMSLAEPVQS